MSVASSAVIDPEPSEELLYFEKMTFFAPNSSTTVAVLVVQRTGVLEDRHLFKIELCLERMSSLASAVRINSELVRELICQIFFPLAKTFHLIN